MLAEAMDSITKNGIKRVIEDVNGFINARMSRTIGIGT